MSFWTRRSTPAVSVVVVRAVRDLPLAAHTYTELRSAGSTAAARTQLDEIVNLLNNLNTAAALEGLPTIRTALLTLGYTGEQICEAVAKNRNCEPALARFWQRMQVSLVATAASALARV